MPATTTTSSRRFDVAISYPGERRPFVEEVASHLAVRFGQKRILYDKYHEAEFARLDLDDYLPELYGKQAELIVVFLCPEFANKRWCRLEWRRVKQLIKTPEQERIMLLRLGDPGDLSGLGILSGDGYADIGARGAKEIADLICERLSINQGGTAVTGRQARKPEVGDKEGAPPADAASEEAAAPDRRREWVEKTTALFSEADKGALCERFGTKLETSGPRIVCEAMDGLSHVDFAALGNAVLEDFVGDGTERRHPQGKILAPVAEAVTETGLAARLGSIVLGRVKLLAHGVPGGGIVQLPTLYPLVADYFNAGMDKRPPEFKEVPPSGKKAATDPWQDLREYGHGLWPCFAVPIAPATGFQSDPLDLARSILGHLGQQLGIPKDLSEEERFKRTNDRLRAMATPRFGSLVKRMYYLFVSDGRDRGLSMLQAKLPELRLCELRKGDSIEDEEALIDQLKRFYARKRKRMNA